MSSSATMRLRSKGVRTTPCSYRVGEAREGMSRLFHLHTGRSATVSFGVDVDVEMKLLTRNLFVSKFLTRNFRQRCIQCIKMGLKSYIHAELKVVFFSSTTATVSVSGVERTEFRVGRAVERPEGFFDFAKHADERCRAFFGPKQRGEEYRMTKILR